MKIQCPECNALVTVDELQEFPAEHVCEECGACFEPESHLVFDEKLGAHEESVAPPGE